MNLALLRKVAADLRAHRLQMTLVFLVLAASAATLTLSLSVARAADEPWERAFEEANGAHLTLRAFRAHPGDRLADLTRAATLTGVTSTSGPYAQVDSALVHDGQKHALLVQEAPDALPEVNRPLIAEGRWSSAPGEVVLDRALARDAGVEPGDTVSLLGPEGLVELRVAGLSVSPWRGPQPDWEPLAYAARDTLRLLEPNEDAWLSVFAARLADPAMTTSAVQQVFQRFNDAPVEIERWDNVRDEVVFWNEINSIFLGMFSAFALVAVGLIVANLISARVLAQRRDIGLLKAVGFTPGQVTAAFVVEHLLVALGASLLGVAAGVAISPLFLRRLAESMNTTAVPLVDPLSIVLVLLAVSLVVTAFTIAPAWRAGRVSTLAAITSAAVDARRGPSRLAWLAQRLRLAPVVTLGLKDAFARPLRSLLTVAALALTIVTIIFTLGMEALFHRVFDNPAVQGEPFDLVVTPERISPDATAALLDADPGVESWHTRSTVQAAVGQATRGQRAPGFSLRLVDGNVRDAGYIVSEGRMFEQPGEAVVAWGLMERFGLRVGDTLTVTVSGRTVPLTITGRYLDDDNDGEVAMTSVATFEALGVALPERSPGSFFVNLAPGVDEAAATASLLAAAGYQIDVWTSAEEEAADAEAQSLRVVLAGLSVVLLVIGLVNLLSTTVLSVRERMRDMGVFRAIGMTPAQVVASVMSSTGLLALLATAVGVPLGLWVYRTVFRVVGTDMLSAPPEWHTPPPWWQVALIVPGVIALAALASAAPARNAARVEVAEALRHE